MKNKLFLIIVFVAAAVMITLGVYTASENKSNNKVSNEQYDLKEFGRIKTCYSEDCENSTTDIYAKISYDHKSKKLQEVIEKLNKQIESDYKEVTKSNLSATSCESIPKTNKYSIRFYHEYNSYSNDNIVYLSLKRDKLNICDNTHESYQYESYYYDSDKDKMLSQEELLDRLGYNEEDVTYSVTTELARLSRDENINVQYRNKYDDAVIYLDTAGNVYISFYVESIKQHKATTLIKK